MIHDCFEIEKNETKVLKEEEASITFGTAPTEKKSYELVEKRLLNQ